MRHLPHLFFALLLASCGQREPERESVEFAAMGTTGRITVRGEGSDTAWQVVVGRIHELEGIFSHWQKMSPVWAFNREDNTEPHGYPAELIELVATSVEINQRTEGAFDITAGPASWRKGFGPVLEIGEDDRIAIGSHLLEIDAGSRTLRKLDPAVKIDLSAIAKGYAIDRVAERLEENGIEDYLIELGGELRGGPGGKWKVGIEKPDTETGGIRRTVALSGKSIATSGSYRQRDGDEHHIIDPKTGDSSPISLVAVSVLADNATEADALATALMAMGLKRGLEFAKAKGITASFVTEDEDGRKAHDTADFPKS